MEEKILGVIPNASLKTGFLRSKRYTLVITEKRLIAARITKELLKEEAQKRREEAKREGRGKLKQFLAGAITGFVFANRYLEMKPEEIENENPENFSIYSSDVIDSRLKRGMISEDEDGTRTQYPHSLVIKTKDRKYSFSFSGDFAQIENLLLRIR